MYYYRTALLKKVKLFLKNGGVIAYPTESCYGFGCDPFNFKAIEKVIKIKARNKTKGLIVIAGNKVQLKKLISPMEILNNPEIDKYWPGFYSLILPVSQKISKNLTGKHSKVAVRVTQHEGVQQLCHYLNMPLVSTSANKTSFKSIKTYRECLRQFGKQVMVLPGIIDFAKKPSSIIDWETGLILR